MSKRRGALNNQMSDSDYRFWQLIISAIAAAGTVGAVIVALCLASRKSRPRIRVRARLEDFTAVDRTNGRRVNVWITNTGPLPVTLRGAVWEIGFFGKKSVGQPIPLDRYNAEANEKLSFGEQARYSLEESEFKKSVINKMPPGWLRGCCGIRPRVKLVAVTTTTGVCAESLVDPDVRRLFVEAGEKED